MESFLEGWAERWKERVVVPILNEREGKEVGNYRKVPLMSTGYKIYAAMVAKRIRKKTEWKEIILQNQTGFRKGMRTLTTIYMVRAKLFNTLTAMGVTGDRHSTWLKRRGGHR